MVSHITILFAHLSCRGVKSPRPDLKRSGRTEEKKRNIQSNIEGGELGRQKEEENLAGLPTVSTMASFVAERSEVRELSQASE